MKNIFLAMAVGLTLVACEKVKEESLAESKKKKEINFKPVSDYTLDQIPNIPNDQNIEDLMVSQDRDEEKLNRYLYQIGLATREFIKDENFNKIILKMARESETQTAYLLDLEFEAPEYFEAINENLGRQNLSLQLISDDMTHAPVNPNPDFPETAVIEKYEPGIFIPNLEIIDGKKQPVISPNIETDCSLDESIEDFIVSWYYMEEGDMIEIILGEETSLVTSNPLFLVDHCWRPEEGVKLTKNDPHGHEDDSLTDRTITQFNSEEISIKTGYRHESGTINKSEFCYVGARAPKVGAPYYIFSSQFIKIREFKHNEVNMIFVIPRLHSSVYTPYADNRVYWNTYERDWNRSPKDLGYVQAPFPTNPNSVAIWGRMRYNNDWYAWIPNTVIIHATPFEWFGWEESVNFENWKSRYEVHRIEQ